MLDGWLELELYISEVNVSFLSLLVQTWDIGIFDQLTCQLALGMNNKVVDNFISFP